MKKLILLTGFFLSSFAMSAEVIEIDKEDLVVAEEGGVVSETVSKSEPKVVILNNQNQKVNQGAALGKNAQARVSNQPVVHVMSTPISTTYAVELKKSRQEAEMQTEQKIVEQLESSRLRDEQERLKKMFGHKPASKTVVSSQAIVTQTEDSVGTDESEIYAEIVSPIKEKNRDSIYIGVHGGQSSNLTRIENVTSHGSLGVAFGATDESGLMMESKFFYSKHILNDLQNVDYFHYDGLTKGDIYQLSGVLSLNYTPTVSSRFKPYAGVAISYNYWIYSFNDNDYTENACSGITLEYCDNQTKSDSIDLGANIGMDFMLNKRISVGANMLINIVNIYNNRRNNNDYPELNSISKKTNIEETNWLIASINAKLYF